MSRSRIGSLGRRLSYWLALQSLAGLVVVCAAVYGATHLGFQARQSEELVQKQVQLRHLLAESTHDGDVVTLKHKLDDFFIGHPDMALALTRADGSAFYSRSSPPPTGDVRVARFAVPEPAPGQGSLDAVLARRPQIALVDELAHTNVDGSRHPKRYSDVAELLEDPLHLLLES